MNETQEEKKKGLHVERKRGKKGREIKRGKERKEGRKKERNKIKELMKERKKISNTEGGGETKKENGLKGEKGKEKQRRKYGESREQKNMECGMWKTEKNQGRERESSRNVTLAALSLQLIQLGIRSKQLHAIIV